MFTFFNLVHRNFFRLIILFLFLYSCSTNSTNDLSVFENTQALNKNCIHDLLSSEEKVDILARLDLTRRRIKSYKEMQESALSASKESYEFLTNILVELISDNGGIIENIKNAHGWKDLEIVSCNDVANVNFSQEKEIVQSLEKLYIKFSSMFSKNDQFPQSTVIKSSNESIPTEICKGYHPRFCRIIKSIYAELIFPEKIKEVSATDYYFKNKNLYQLIENINLFRNRILRATQKIINAIGQEVDRSWMHFNKIEPVAFKYDELVNDSIGIRVFISAYDSTYIPTIHYTINGVAKDFETRNSRILVPKNARHVKGVISTIENGEMVWRPWSIEIK